MTSTQFDVETAERLERIRNNPNPQTRGRLRRLLTSSIAWGRSLERRRAYEAAKSMFAVLGAAGYSGYLAGMHSILIVLSLVGMAGTWYAIYLTQGGNA